MIKYRVFINRIETSVQKAQVFRDSLNCDFEMEEWS